MLNSLSQYSRKYITKNIVHLVTNNNFPSVKPSVLLRDSLWVHRIWCIYYDINQYFHNIFFSPDFCEWRAQWARNNCFSCSGVYSALKTSHENFVASCFAHYIKKSAHAFKVNQANYYWHVKYYGVYIKWEVIIHR